MGRRTPKSRDTQQQIKAAAADVFATRGYGVSGVDHIVEHAGTTRGTFYYYFSGKADVARDLQEELWAAAAGKAAAARPGADYLSSVRHGLEAYVNALKDLGSERRFLREGFEDPTLTMVDGQGERWGTHFVRERLVEAMDNGEIPRQDIDQATSMLIDALQALTLAALNGEDTTDAMRVIEDVNEGLSVGRSPSRRVGPDGSSPELAPPGRGDA